MPVMNRQEQMRQGKIFLKLCEYWQSRRNVSLQAFRFLFAKYVRVAKNHKFNAKATNALPTFVTENAVY